MSKKIRVGIIGVGNCASSLVQGVEYYKGALGTETIPGLMHPVLGGYHVNSIEFSCAFDVTKTKVGLDLSKAIFAEPNNTIQFCEHVLPWYTSVRRGPTLDGIGKYLNLEESPEDVCDVVNHLKNTGTEVLVSYLPVGSQKATEFYAEAALQAKCAFINCIPVFIASNPAWATRFTEAGVPIIGDDIKSQVGATIVHRVLAKLFKDRGVQLDDTYQLNFGGNTDFLNMLERERLVSKKISKTQAVTSQLKDVCPSAEHVHVGPSDYVPWLQDRKFAHIRLEGTGFGGVKTLCEVKLEVWDSPNSAGVVIDAIRCAKLALDAKVGGPLTGPSSYFMKSPPIQHSDEVAKELVGSFIRQMTGIR